VLLWALLPTNLGSVPSFILSQSMRNQSVFFFIATTFACHNHEAWPFAEMPRLNGIQR
jgi:hypothetical protein